MPARIAAALAGLAVGLLVAACGTIGFAGDTVVTVDGGITRTTRISASGQADYEEVLALYDLPPGGSWTEIAPRSASGVGEAAMPERIYRLERRFAPGEPVPADFRRRNAAGTAAAQNEITLRVRHYWIVDTFDYEETFSDIVTPERFEAAFRRLYSTMLTALAEEIARLPAAGLTVEEATANLAAYIDPLADRFLATMRQKCFRPRATGSECEAAIGDETELATFVSVTSSDALAIESLAEILAAPAAVTPEEWREVLGVALERLGEREDVSGPAMFESVEENLLGVHGFLLFESYRFELSVVLPGDPVASNADGRENGAERWSFESLEFAFNPQTLYARSRIVHFDRIVLLLISAIVLAGILAGARTRE